MDITSPNAVALALALPEDELLWKGLLRSQGVAVLGLGSNNQLAEGTALVADVAALIARGLPPGEAARRLPGVTLLVRLPGRAGISRAERDWAQARGIASLLPGGTVAAWRESIVPMLERILFAAGLPTIDDAAVERHVNDLVKRGIEPRSGPVKNIFADALLLERERVEHRALFEAMQGSDGVEVQDRTYHGKRYRDCFVASEAVDWLEQRMKLRRATAETACRFLWRTGRIHHVVREAPFADDFLFFRFAGTREQMDRVDLAALEHALRAPGGVEIADRTWRGKKFPRCFVGTEAVEWIMRRERLPFGAAEAVGQSLLELGVLRHVVGEHDFIGEGYFYRLVMDEVAAVPLAAA